MTIRRLALAALFFACGIAIGKSLPKIDSSIYVGKSKPEAAKALLDAARTQAGDGSWERIAIGRVYYLGGNKAEGQTIFDDIIAKKHKASDIFRIARVYREAGEWAKARPLFDQYVKENPDDEKELAEVGAYYLMNGDRATAEALFDRSFKTSSELWATIAAAGSYVNVVPQE